MIYIGLRFLTHLVFYNVYMIDIIIFQALAHKTNNQIDDYVSAYICLNDNLTLTLIYLKRKVSTGSQVSNPSMMP